MKRVQFFTLTLTAFIILWALLYPLFDTFLYWFSLPIVALGLFGIYSLTSILKSVFTLKDYPDQEQKLHYDIGRAKQFYKEKGIQL